MLKNYKVSLIFTNGIKEYFPIAINDNDAKLKAVDIAISRGEYSSLNFLGLTCECID